MALQPLSFVSQAFDKEETSAFILYTICLNHFGSSIHEWEPETMWLEIQDDFRTDPHESNKDKIQAAIALVTINKFYHDFQAFEGISKAFNNENPDLDWITPLDPAECAWAVAQARLIDETPEPFSEEIKTYVREILTLNGMVMSPPELAFCNLGAHVNIDEMFPHLKERVLKQQKAKLKWIELHIATQKAQIEKDLKLYFK